jgi:hypothetical protein
MNFLSKLKNALFGKSEPSKSATGAVDVVDIAKVTRTGLLMGLATAVTYMLANVKPEMFGDHAGIAALVLTVVGEFSLRFLKSNGK